MKLAKILIILSACALCVSCGKGGSTTTNGNASNGAAGSQAGAKAAKPEDAAKGLFEAWKAKDRAAAASFAPEDEVADLFKKEFPEKGMEFHGCEKAAGGYSCVYTAEGGGINMHVLGSDAAGYKVSTVFIGD